MNLDHLPKPTDLMDHPQLAIVVALETTLLAAMRALLAVHTDMLDDTFPRTVTENDLWADRSIILATQLALSLEKYRRTILEEALAGGEDF